MKKFIFSALLIVFNLFSQDISVSQNSRLVAYTTDTLELVTELPPEFAVSLSEYAEKFSLLLHSLLSEWRQEASSPKIKIYLFQDCEEFLVFTKNKGLKTRRHLQFLKFEQESWDKFKVAGCVVSFYHLYQNLQRTIVSGFLYDPQKKLPFWMYHGLLNYFTYSSFNADDSSVVPYLNFDYINTIKKYQLAQKRSLTLFELVNMDSETAKPSKKYNQAFYWALMNYLMDVNPEGRVFLKKQFQIRMEGKESLTPLVKFPERSTNNPINEEDWSVWIIEKLPVLPGFGYYQKFREQNVHSSRRDSLKKALQEYPEYWFYHKELSKEYLEHDNFNVSVFHAERAFQLKPISKLNLKNLIISTFRIGDYSKTEYYLNLSDQFGYFTEKFKDERQFLIHRKVNNQDIPKYIPLLNPPPSWY
jgi:hypothetical protein